MRQSRKNLGISSAILGVVIGFSGWSAQEPYARDPRVSDAGSSLGTFREVEVSDLEDTVNWDDDLELRLEQEFWDTLANSDHEHYEVWRAKTKDYIASNADASPRLTLLLTAGGVFRQVKVYEDPEEEQEVAAEYQEETLGGAQFTLEAMSDHPPATVFARAVLTLYAFLADEAAEGFGVLEDLVNTQGTPEGIVTAASLYGQIDDDAAIRYAISILENCETHICNWTSQLAPYKPIVMLITLAELYAALGEFEATNAALDRAEELAKERRWPWRFTQMIGEFRESLPSHEYGEGTKVGLTTTWVPSMLINRDVGCAACHLGAKAGQTGVSLDEPYEGADVVTPIPELPDMSHLIP